MDIGNGCHSQGVASFVCAQAGCPNCLETLLRENKGLIHSVIRHQGMIGIEFVDLIQEGRIGLWYAIQHYDPGRGTTFSSFAWASIRYRLWNARAYADRSPDDEAEAWLELADEIEEDWWRGNIRQALLEVVGKLPARLERLIRLAYGLDGQGGCSLAAIGRRWGISRERVRQLHNEALALLRLPALSMQLRSLCEQDSRQAYQQALSLNQAWQHSQRRRR
jgi:RNA polymerase sigma factor (sigma-70 family)